MSYLRTQIGEPYPRRNAGQYSHDDGQDQGGGHDGPCIFRMHEAIDQAYDPGHEYQQKVDERTTAFAGGSNQIADCEQQCQSAEKLCSGQQPGSKIAPLDLEGVGVGEIAEEGAEEEWDGSGKQDRV